MPGIRFDDGLSAIIPSEDWETVAQGLTFTEGPVWHPDGYLLFSDIPNSRIHKWRAGDLGVYREPSRQSNGLTLDRERRVIACEHGGRVVSREQDGVVHAIARYWEGKKLNSPNDACVRSDGRIFFTDPPYGITEEQRELPFNGMYTIAPQGSLSLLETDFDRPNGICLSPDERTLYVADTERRHVRAFDVDREGATSNGRVFAEMRESGRPDGMKVDREGRLYICARGVQVFASDGAPLGIIDCPQAPANCAWGDDGSTLYITARTAVFRTRIETIGVAPHLSQSSEAAYRLHRNA